jgi:hypothetical protein
MARYPTSIPRQTSIAAWLSRGIDNLQKSIGGKKPSGSPARISTEPFPDSPKEPKAHLDWLDESMFSNLSTHHPLISPSADIASPFVRRTLELLAFHGTKISIHCGTAEWFYLPIVDLASAAKVAGVDVSLVENEGGLHSKACLSWPERGGPAAVLQRQILQACGVRDFSKISVSKEVLDEPRSASDIVHVIHI